MTEPLSYPYSLKLIEELDRQERWKYITTSVLATNQLVPTKTYLSIERMLLTLQCRDPEITDTYPHVVEHKEKYYIHTGHYQWMVKRCQGANVTMRVRVILEDRTADE